ncbi:MAG TPA: hypothetical protein VKE69_09515 [Planctomycetota bacterium]|nr:hypothetical protein [Planctomycetota bacterium]
MKRIVLGGLVVLVLLAIAVAFGLDSIVRAGLEKGATYALDVKTDVKSVSLGLFRGAATIEGLRIANPRGFSEGAALAADRIATEVKIGSLFTDEVVVPLVDLQAPEIFVEVSAGSTNLGTLLDNLQRKTGGAKPKEKAPSSEPGKKYRVGILRITGAKVRVGQAGLGSTQLVLGPIEMRDLGNDPKSLGQILQVVISEILKNASQLKGLPNEIARALSQDAQKAVGELRQAVESAAKDVQGTVEDAVKGIDQILKPTTKKK